MIANLQLPDFADFRSGANGPFALAFLPDRTVRMEPEANGGYQPKVGETCQVKLARVLDLDRDTARVTVECQPLKLTAIFADGKSQGRKTRPKCKRRATGRFVDPDRVPTSSAPTRGPAGLTPEMREAARLQASVVKLEPPARGSLAWGVGSKGAARRQKNGNKK